MGQSSDPFIQITLSLSGCNWGTEALVVVEGKLKRMSMEKKRGKDAGALHRSNLGLSQRETFKKK